MWQREYYHRIVNNIYNVDDQALILTLDPTEKSCAPVETPSSCVRYATSAATGTSPASATLIR